MSESEDALAEGLAAAMRSLDAERAHVEALEGALRQVADLPLTENISVARFIARAALAGETESV